MLPKPQWTSADGFHTAAHQFNEWGKRAHDMGMRFAFHNHDYEFRQFDGTTGYDILSVSYTHLDVYKRQTLYVSLDWQFSPHVTESFVARCEVVTAGLAQSVEPSLVARDITSAQSDIDRVLNIPDVKWAYITAPNGEVLADTFVPQFPDELKRQLPTVNDYAWIRLNGEQIATLVIRKSVLTGIVGTVWVGYSQANLCLLYTSRCV